MVATCVVLLTAALAGAPSAIAQSEPPAAAGEGATAGVIFATFDSPFFVVIEEEIQQGAAAANIQTLPTLSSDFDVATEATNIRNLITQNVDVLIVNPSDTAAVVPSLEAAAEAGIPVVAFDALPDSGTAYVSVRADNIAMGAAACESLASLIGGAGKVAEIQGDLANIGGRERAQGFEDCMAQEYPEVEILKVPAHWNADEAATGLQALLTANSDLAGIYTHTGGGYFAPVSQVLQRNNRWFPAGEEGHMPWVSIDGEPVELQAIRDGYLDSTVSQPADLYGRLSIEYARKALDGVELSEGPTEHGSVIVRQPNGILEDLLAATPVTKDNVDDPGLWANAASQ
jgi:ABC-type sugar transport system substrate-binding protein